MDKSKTNLVYLQQRPDQILEQDTPRLILVTTSHDLIHDSKSHKHGWFTLYHSLHVVLNPFDNSYEHTLWTLFKNLLNKPYKVLK